MLYMPLSAVFTYGLSAGKLSQQSEMQTNTTGSCYSHHMTEAVNATGCSSHPAQDRAWTRTGNRQGL